MDEPRAAHTESRVRRRMLLLSSASLGLLLALAGCDPRHLLEARPERIILLSMDTVRADHVSGYGDADTTPTLAEIEREGATFRRVYAASSYTLPSHMSIFTGLDPAEHGVSRMNARLNPAVPTLAAILRKAGYRTQAFHEGTFVDPRFGFDEGFDGYQQLRVSLTTAPSLRQVVAWMFENRHQPYFLFLHTYHAHFPYGGYAEYRASHPERGLRSPEELRRDFAASRGGTVSPELWYECTLQNQLADMRSGLLGCGANRPGVEFTRNPHFADDLAAIVASYDARIREIDGVIAKVREVLQELGQWDDTLLIVTSDHGDAFFEHDLYRHAFVPFDEVLRVPLVVSYPRVLRDRAPRVIDGLVWQLDLLPTIAGFAGADVPPGLRGMDLRPVILGNASIDEERVVYPGVLRAAQLEQVPLRRVVVDRDHKLIEGHPLFGDAEGYYFDLASDPGEKRNLRETRPGEYRTLLESARAYDAGLSPVIPLDQQTGQPLAADATGAPSTEQLSPETREQLRALGYGD